MINLRGANPTKAWYRDEVAAARRLGLTVIDFRMKASRRLSGEEAAGLIRLLRSVQKPVLVHCKGGADRAGLASALYLATVKGLPKALAQQQLSLAYGHVAWPFAPAYAMDESFLALQRSPGDPGS